MSIFRYPGSKSKLLKVIRPQIDLMIRNGATAYHEPCVGGGAVVASVAKDYPGLQLHINDYDPYMHLFWQVLVNGSENELKCLFELIRQTPTVDLFKQLRMTEPESYMDMAYQAVFFNRTTFSGIHNSGPYGGYAQDKQHKITGRYQSERIISDIQRLRLLLRGRTTVSRLSVIHYVQFMVGKNDITYLDPPYFEKGNSLYPTGMTHQEHQTLATVLRSKKNWVLSYDRCQPIAEMYDFATRLLVPVKYSVTAGGTKRGTQFEYLILPLGMPVAVECVAMVVEPESDAGLKLVA